MKLDKCLMRSQACKAERDEVRINCQDIECVCVCERERERERQRDREREK